MKIIQYTSPPQDIKEKLYDLVQACHAHDGTRRLPYLDNSYNFNAAMPAFLLAHLDGDLAGFLAIYADEEGEAEVSVYVQPALRRQGVARALLAAFKEIAEQYHLTDIDYVSEVSFLDKHPDFAEQFSYDLEDSEFWLEKAADPADLPSLPGVQVALGQLDMVEDIAHFQAAVFDLPMETALHYAKEGMVNEDSLLYILRKEQQVLASCAVDTSFGTNHLFGLAVAGDFQGQGLGSHLVRSLMADLSQRNGRVFQLVVEKANDGAFRLYSRLGFEPVTQVVYLKDK